ncbi:hypothetical protein F5Y14DRAFT_459933 [Nemania sp. NC0429]|nr:hypothetical protein F5Y14DRAFT_459933 [Nemania sp. NC0429]
MQSRTEEETSASPNDDISTFKEYITCLNNFLRAANATYHIPVLNTSYSYQSPSGNTGTDTGTMQRRLDSILTRSPDHEPCPQTPRYAPPLKGSFLPWEPTQLDGWPNPIPRSEYVSSLPLATSNNIGIVGRSVPRNYGGDLIVPRNDSADIPADLNTSVWITNLPPDCTYSDLLSTIRDTGKVYAAVLSPAGGQHTTAAAKIVFFDVEGRRRLEKRASAGAFAVGAYVPSVVPNRVRTAARPAGGPQSRVLLISGPADIVNEPFLRPRFQAFCGFDIEYVRDYPPRRDDGSGSSSRSTTTNTVTMEWAFASYRCQAERVYAALRSVAETVGCICVEYGHDPCDRQDV